jgi:hypothetical protein
VTWKKGLRVLCGMLSSATTGHCDVTAPVGLCLHTVRCLLISAAYAYDWKAVDAQFCSMVSRRLSKFQPESYSKVNIWTASTRNRLCVVVEHKNYNEWKLIIGANEVVKRHHYHDDQQSKFILKTKEEDDCRWMATTIDQSWVETVEVA